MKKYIIAAAAALAIGMALSACAKEGEAIVPIIVEGEAEQQQAAPTPEATQDMAAQVSKIRDRFKPFVSRDVVFSTSYQARWKKSGLIGGYALNKNAFNID